MAVMGRGEDFIRKTSVGFQDFPGMEGEAASLADGKLVKSRRRIGRRTAFVMLGLSILIGIFLGALAAYWLRLLPRYRYW